MQRLKLGLMLLVLFFCVPARAQDVPPAPQPPVVLELFSSQACIFCPRADRLFADLLTTQPNLIGIACHIDYFDVKTGSLSQQFCTERQTEYERLLRTGPAYTPQMVVQGGIDVVGYKMEDIVAGMKKAAELPILPLYVFATDNENEFRVALPDTAPDLGGQAALYLIAYDRPHEVTIAEGRNRGQKAIYYNIASDFRDLGGWPAGQQGTVVTAALTDVQEGFALLLQDPATGKMLAAGKFIREPTATAPEPAQ